MSNQKLKPDKFQIFMDAMTQVLIQTSLSRTKGELQNNYRPERAIEKDVPDDVISETSFD